MPVLRMIMKDANTAQEFLQAGTFAPLIDQKGSFVRYELRMNEDEFNFINANIFQPAIQSVSRNGNTASVLKAASAQLNTLLNCS